MHLPVVRRMGGQMKGLGQRVVAVGPRHGNPRGRSEATAARVRVEELGHNRLGDDGQDACIRQLAAGSRQEL